MKRRPKNQRKQRGIQEMRLIKTFPFKRVKKCARQRALRG